MYKAEFQILTVVNANADNKVVANIGQYNRSLLFFVFCTDKTKVTLLFLLRQFLCVPKMNDTMEKKKIYLVT